MNKLFLGKVGKGKGCVLFCVLYHVLLRICHLLLANTDKALGRAVMCAPFIGSLTLNVTLYWSSSWSLSTVLKPIYHPIVHSSLSCSFAQVLLSSLHFKSTTPAI